MEITTFLVVLLAIEGTLALGLLGGLLLRAAILRLRARRRRAAVEAARTALVGMLEDGSDARAAEAALRSLSRRDQMQVLWEIAPNVLGDSRRVLTSVADSIGLLEWADREATRRRWWKRLLAIRLLTALRIDRAAVRRALDDPHPLVRYQAIDWASQHTDPGLVADLVQHFDDDNPLCTFAIQDALHRLGRPALEPLIRYLEERGGEVHPAAVDAAVALADPRLLPIAEGLTRSDRAAIRSRAASLLAAIGGPTAIERLTALLQDPDAEVRAAAAAGLGETGAWPKAPELARALTDASWPVRRAAALALRGFGPPGTLLLRSSLESPDRFAADMARHVLELPTAPMRQPV